MTSWNWKKFTSKQPVYQFIALLNSTEVSNNSTDWIKCCKKNVPSVQRNLCIKVKVILCLIILPNLLHTFLSKCPTRWVWRSKKTPRHTSNVCRQNKFSSRSHHWTIGGNGWGRNQMVGANGYTRTFWQPSWPSFSCFWKCNHGWLTCCGIGQILWPDVPIKIHSRRSDYPCTHYKLLTLLPKLIFGILKLTLQFKFFNSELYTWFKRLYISHNKKYFHKKQEQTNRACAGDFYSLSPK